MYLFCCCCGRVIVRLCDVIKEQTIDIRHLLRLLSFSKVDSNKLRINLKNKVTLIGAKFDAYIINISEVTSRKTKWPRFFGLPCFTQFNAVYERAYRCTDENAIIIAHPCSSEFGYKKSYGAASLTH